jgi:hypothetical protein
MWISTRNLPQKGCGRDSKGYPFHSKYLSLFENGPRNVGRSRYASVHLWLEGAYNLRILKAFILVKLSTRKGKSLF